MEEAVKEDHIGVPFADRRINVLIVRRPGYSAGDESPTLSEIRDGMYFPICCREQPEIRPNCVVQRERQRFSVRRKNGVQSLPGRNAMSRNWRQKPRRSRVR